MKVNKKEFLGVIAGTILGDSWLSRHSGTTLECAHEAKYLQYLEHKKQFLEQLTKVSIYERKRISNLTGKEFHSYQLRTYSHPFYGNLYERSYINGRKVLDPHLMTTLNSQGLAWWYMDDGCRQSTRERTVILCTEKFSYPEQRFIQQSLYKKFGLETNLQKYHGGYRIAFPVKSHQKLFSLIRPFVVSCMEYKLPSHDKLLNEDEDIVSSA